MKEYKPFRPRIDKLELEQWKFHMYLRSRKCLGEVYVVGEIVPSPLRRPTVSTHKTQETVFWVSTQEINQR